MIGIKDILGISCIFAGGILVGKGLSYSPKEDNYNMSGSEFIFPVDEFSMSCSYDEDMGERVYILSSKLGFDEVDEEEYEDYTSVVEELSYSSDDKNANWLIKDDVEDIEDNISTVINNVFDNIEDDDEDEENLDNHPEEEFDPEYYIDRDGTAILMIDESKVDEIKHYEHDVLYYHRISDTVIDERNEVIENYRDILGDFVKISNFGVGSEDPDVMYICNHNTQTIYEVINEHVPWKEE